MQQNPQSAPLAEDDDDWRTLPAPLLLLCMLYGVSDPCDMPLNEAMPMSASVWWWTGESGRPACRSRFSSSSYTGADGVSCMQNLNPGHVHNLNPMHVTCLHEMC